MRDEKRLSRTERELAEIEEKMMERRIEADGAMLYPESFLNMQDFLTLKKFDLSSLQHALRDLGLSSLHYAHFHLMYTLRQERAILRRLLDEPSEESPISESMMPEAAFARIEERARFLKEDPRHPSLMLTLPEEGVEDPVIEEVLRKGEVLIVRINTAHGTPEQWRETAEKIARINAEERPARPIRIYVDLAGPKIRTGRIRRVVLPFKTCTRHTAELLLVPADMGPTRFEEDPEAPGTRRAVIAIENEFFSRLRSADFVTIDDHDRKPRHYKILECSEDFCRLECKKKALIAPETTLSLQIDKKHYLHTHPLDLQRLPETIRLFAGERVLLSQEDEVGRLTPEAPYKAIVPCTLGAEVFPFVSEGDRVYIDDGKIGLQVDSKSPEGLLCRVVEVKPGGALVKEGRGVNFPDTPLKIPALTREDRVHLESVRPFADIIGLSFAQSREDIRELKALLRESPKKGIVAKIETMEGVRHLPDILYELFSWEKGAVMLARGDLAIEADFENLARVQEEILMLCEAAHTPVIYATQILENLMKKNLPSRAEIVDASMAARRCDVIMLNKGPFVPRTIGLLERVVESMRPLYHRGEPLLSRLEEWDGFRDRILESSAQE